MDRVPGAEEKHSLGEGEADHGAVQLAEHKRLLKFYTSEVSQSHKRNELLSEF